MTDKQSRDKVAHAIRDAIKHDETIPRQFDFSGCYGEQQHKLLDQQVCVTSNNNNSENNKHNIISINICGTTYNDEINFDPLIANSEREDSSSCVRLTTTTANKQFRNIFQSTYNNNNNNNPQQKSIYDYATADYDCYDSNEISSSVAGNNDWFLHVIEWTLGCNNEISETIHLQDVCYNNERQSI